MDRFPVSGKSELALLEGFLDAAFEEMAPCTRVRKSLLKPRRRKEDVEFAISHENHQVFRTNMCSQCSGGSSAVLRQRQSRDQREKLTARC